MVAQAEQLTELQAHVLQTQAVLQLTLGQVAGKRAADAASLPVPGQGPEPPRATFPAPRVKPRAHAAAQPPEAPTLAPALAVEPALAPSSTRHAPLIEPEEASQPSQSILPSQVQAKPPAPGARRKAAVAAVAKLMASAPLKARPAKAKSVPPLPVKRPRDGAEGEAKAPLPEPPSKVAKPTATPMGLSTALPTLALASAAPKLAAPRQPPSGESPAPGVSFSRLLAAYVSGTTSMSQQQMLTHISKLCPDLKALVSCLGAYLTQEYRAIASAGQRQRLLELVGALHQEWPRLLQGFQNMAVTDAKDCCGPKHDVRKPLRLAVILQFLTAWLVATGQEGALAVLVFELFNIHITPANSTDPNVARLLALLLDTAQQCPRAIHLPGSLLSVAYHVVLAEVVRSASENVRQSHEKLLALLELPSVPPVESSRLMDRCIGLVLGCQDWADPTAVEHAAEAVRALHVLAMRSGFISSWERLARNDRLIARLQAERKELHASKERGVFGHSPADTSNVVQALYVSILLALSKALVVSEADESRKELSRQFMSNWFHTVLKHPADFPLFCQLDAAKGVATLQQTLVVADLPADLGTQALQQWGQATETKFCCTPAAAKDPVMPYQLRVLLRTLSNHLHLPTPPPP
eukprot:GGOE01037375.1.p1 GENE.GGOE01037375.1~~GGOE01037375.1.p1  ORF type:complete len:707 (-),score=204.73 GGOE01037375.1:11-1927(-)